MKRKIVLIPKRSLIGLIGVAGVVIVIVTVLFLEFYDIPPFTDWRSYGVEEPEIEGHIVIVDGQPYEGCWVFELLLTFKPKKGMAKGVHILLDPGELEIVGATPSFYASREGRYLWRYAVLGKEEVGSVELALRIPVEEVEHEIHRQIRLYYYYTNEEPVLLDTETIVTRGHGLGVEFDASILSNLSDPSSPVLVELVCRNIKADNIVVSPFPELGYNPVFLLRIPDGRSFRSQSFRYGPPPLHSVVLMPGQNISKVFDLYNPPWYVWWVGTNKHHRGPDLFTESGEYELAIIYHPFYHERHIYLDEVSCRSSITLNVTLRFRRPIGGI